MLRPIIYSTLLWLACITVALADTDTIVSDTREDVWQLGHLYEQQYRAEEAVKFLTVHKEYGARCYTGNFEIEVDNSVAIGLFQNAKIEIDKQITVLLSKVKQ